MLKDNTKQEFENEVITELQLHKLVNSNNNTLSQKLEELKNTCQTGRDIVRREICNQNQQVLQEDE